MSKVTTLTLEENGAMFPPYAPARLTWSSNLVLLSDEVTFDDGDDEEPKTFSWGELIEGQEVPVIALRGEGGLTLLAGNRELVRAAARQAHPELFRENESLNNSSSHRDWQAERRLQLLKNERIEKAVIEGLLGAKKLTDSVWDLVFEAQVVSAEEFCNVEDLETMAGALGWEKKEEAAEEEEEQESAGAFLLARIKEFPERQKIAFVFQLLTACGSADDDARTRIYASWSAAFGVDLARVQAEAQAEAEAEIAAEKEKAAIAAGLKWKGGREKAEDFTWDAQRKCVTPDVITPEFADGLEGTFEIMIARSKKGWHAGHYFQIGEDDSADMESSGFVDSTATAYSNKALAVHAGLLALHHFFEEQGVAASNIARVETYLELVRTGGAK